jgi:hypothetical protein
MKRFATGPRILLLGWVLFLVYAYPGFMSYDSVDQLLQARHIEPLTDWHPPMMALLWRLTDHVVAGPFPMLVIQSGAFVLGVNSILRRVMPERSAAIVTSCVLLFPPVFTPLAVIWKDSLMAGFLVAGIAALLSERRAWRIAGFALLFAASGVRHNAPAATLPIIALLAFPAVQPRLKRAAFAIGAWLAITAMAFAANALAIQERAHVFESSLALTDIAGTLKWARHLDDHQILVEYGDLPWRYTDKLRVRAHNVYSPYNTFLDITDPGPRQLFTLPMTDQQLAAVIPDWLDLIEHHLGAYLHYRVDVFGALLDVHDVGDGSIWAGFTDAEWSEPVLSHRAKHSEVQSALVDGVTWLGGTWLYRPWLYAVLCIAFMIMARRDRVPFAILTSGLLYELAMFPITPAATFRYSHWLVVCTIIGGIMLFVLRRRRP